MFKSGWSGFEKDTKDVLGVSHCKYAANPVKSLRHQANPDSAPSTPAHPRPKTNVSPSDIFSKKLKINA